MLSAMKLVACLLAASLRLTESLYISSCDTALGSGYYSSPDQRYYPLSKYYNVLTPCADDSSLTCRILLYPFCDFSTQADGRGVISVEFEMAVLVDGSPVLIDLPITLGGLFTSSSPNIYTVPVRTFGNTSLAMRLSIGVADGIDPDDPDWLPGVCTFYRSRDRYLYFETSLCSFEVDPGNPFPFDYMCGEDQSEFTFADGWMINYPKLNSFGIQYDSGTSFINELDEGSCYVPPPPDTTTTVGSTDTSTTSSTQTGFTIPIPTLRT